MRRRRNRLHSREKEALPVPKTLKAMKHVVAQATARADAAFTAEVFRAVGHTAEERPRDWVKEERSELQRAAIVRAKEGMVPQSVHKAFEEARKKDA